MYLLPVTAEMQFVECLRFDESLLLPVCESHSDATEPHDDEFMLPTGCSCWSCDWFGQSLKRDGP